MTSTYGACSFLHLKACDFFNETLAFEDRIQSGHQLCDGLESSSTDKEFPDLIHSVCERIQKFLSSTEPQILQESPIQQLRRICLEILQKVPNGDHVRPYARSILSLLFKLVEVENEENVLLCVKLIIDLHKYYRPSFSLDVTSFLSFVRRVYRGLQNEASNIFDPRSPIEVQSFDELEVGDVISKTFTITTIHTQEPREDGTFKTYHILPKSCFSLKVMQEIPILVVLMYQLFKQHIHQDVSEFIPLIMDFINLKPTDVQRKNPRFDQDIFVDFMAAQVKTLSFLAYVIKIYQDLVERHSANLVMGIMNLLYNCPPSVTNMRKEFFIAARHILSAPDIRPKFLGVLDELMNEDILIGQGYTVRDALRPLAYSTLADLTHHIRSDLSLAKIARAIDLYGRNMHDDTLPFSIQQMSLRLLLNLVECVRQRTVAATSTAGPSGTVASGASSGTARHLLLQTLRLCVLKARIVAEHYLPALESSCIPETSEENGGDRPKHRLSATPTATGGVINMDTSDCGAVSITANSSTDGLKNTNAPSGDVNKSRTSPLAEHPSKGQLSHMDLRSLIKALMTGIRTIVTSMIQCPKGSPYGTHPSAPSAHTPKTVVAASSSRILSPDELIVLTEYFDYGTRMIAVVQIIVRDGKLFIRSHPSVKSPDERILIETFALTFAQLSPVSFQEIFSNKIHDFVMWCRQSPSYTNMALHLLSQPNKTSIFGHILLSYLVDRLDRLGDGTDESALYMRLLKLCFSSVNMAGTENEYVMKLHLRRIVQGSMQCCLTANEPTAYLTLLRTLFRSIGGGAHDKLYREFFPLLPEMLSTLNRLLRSPHHANARDLLGELCVIVPVRLSTLLPYLSLLMEPLIYVLNCNTVNQGLRTLELCVDNMQPDFLHEHLHQVRGDMLLALYNSLHSSSEYVQKLSFKVLGKLGRFNRTNLSEVRRLRLDPAEGETGPELRLFLNEYKNQPIDLPLRSLVDAAIEVLQDSNIDQPTKVRSWEFLQSVCIASLDLDNRSGRFNLQLDAPYSFLQGTSFVRAVDMFVQKVLCNEWASSSDRELFQAPCCIDGDLDRDLMVRVLAGLFMAGLNKPLRETQGDFITSVVRHLVLVWIAEHMNQIDQTVETKPPAIVAPSAAILDPIARMEDGPTLIPLMVSPEPSYVGSLNGVCFKPDRECHSNRRMLDATLLIDSILFAMGQEDKQLIQPMCVLLEVVHGTVSTVFRSALSEDSADETGVFERANRALIHLPLYSHMAHVLVNMLHHPAWYVKWGACATVICLVRLLHPTWFAIHFIPILRGLVHCIHDLSTQMSQGALSMARDCARLLIQTVFDPSNEDVLSLQPSTPLDDDESSRAPTQTCSSKRPTPNRRRQNSSTPVNQKRPMQLRRGRSASMSSSNPSSSILSGSPDPPEQETLLDESNAGITDRCSNSKQTPLFLIDAVVLELLKALMSETPLVREEARCLLCLLSHRLDRPLSVLLAPHWRTSLGHLLPPQPPTRLYDLPASTQLAVLELNYFFGQAEGVQTKSKSGNGKVPSDVCTGGAGLLKYDLAKRADRSFLVDVRALLNQIDQSNSASPSTTVSPAGTPTSEGASFALGVSRSAYKAGSPMPTVHRLRSVDLLIVACRVLSLTWYLTSQKAQNLAALFKGICCEKEAIHETAFVCLKEFVSHTPIDIELRHANVKPILQNVRQTTNLRLNTARQLSYCAQLFPSTFSERLCDAIYSHLNTLVDSLATKQNASSISTLTPPTLELCAVLVDLFHLIPLATAKHVSLLIELVVRAERALNIEPTSPLRLPLVRFLARYPAETCANLLTGSKWPYDAHAQRILLYVVGCAQGQSVAEYLKTNHHIFSDLIRPTEISEQKSSTPAESRCLLPRYGTPLTAACPRHLAIRVVHLLRNLFPNWLLHTQSITEDSPKSKYRYKALGSPSGSKSCSSSCHPVVASLLSYWRSDAFARRQAHLTLVTLNSGLRDESSSLTPTGMEFVEPEEKTDAGYSASAHQPVTDSSLEPGLLISSGTSCWEHWDEPRLLLDCLLDCVRSDPDNCDLLFIVVIGSARLRSVAGLHPLRAYLDTFLPTASISWHRRLFLHYVSLVRHRLTDTHGVDPCPFVVGANWNTTSGDLYRLLTHLMIPSLTCALQNTSHEEFIGVPPDPYTDNDKDLVHLFISVLLGDPDVEHSTELRVMYYQMAILFTHYVPEYIHLEGPTPQSSRLERLISFAWPCTTSSLSVVDLQEKYTGLQLLAHLISKFDAVKSMAVQVFHCLAKGTHTETKKIVNPALDVLIPAWVQGPDEQQILASTTRKIMLEDHGIQSCIHILGIIVRHADLYYPIRRQLLPHLILIISRLSTQQLPVEQRRLALDMIDTAARWDHRCRQVLLESGMDDVEYTSSVSASVENLYPEQSSSQIPVPLPEGAPIDKAQRDQLLNLMIRFACQAVDTSQNGNMSEASVTRALSQLEFALRADVWGTESCELRLGFIDRYFIPEDNSSSTPSSTAVSATGPSGSGAPNVSSASTVTGSNISGSNAGNASSGSLGTTQTTNLLMALEVLRILFTSLESPTLLQNVKHFSSGLCTLLTRQLANVRLIRSCSNLLRAVLERFPADASHRQKITAYAELFDIYSATLKTIQESFSLYSDNGPKPTLLARLQSAFLLFNATQVQTNPHAFVDRCLVQLVKLTHRLIQDVISPGYSSGSQDTVASAQLTDLLINGLEVIKSRLNVVSNEMRKNSFGPDLCLILDRARDARLFRAVIKILRDWINVPKSEEHFAPTAREKVNFFHKLWQAYPRWIDSNPDVARELLECIYEVYISGNLSRNQELYMKLEQAFCCSLLAPFPDIREKFTSLYLEASQLQFPLQSGAKIAGIDATTSHPDVTFTEASLNESSSAASSPRPATDAAGDREPDLLEMNSPLVCQSASLLVRLLFLFVSCNWDEAHFRDGFWLSLFLDVLLCDVDTTLPPCLSDTSNCFPVPPVLTPVTEQTTLIRSESELFKTMSSSQSELNSLLELQTRGLKDMGRVTFREGLRGVLCLAHRSPALASHLFSQLWPQLWNRLLLRQTPVESSSTTDSDCVTPTLNFGPVDEASADPLTNSSQNLSVAEVRAFVIPQLLRFLTSDQHVNPSEPQPSALGAFLSSLATTPDSTLLYLPVPAISYIGCSYNQWYPVALFLESLCARALKSPGASEFVYSVGLPPPESVDSSTAGCLKLSDLPSGAAALSLIALYDSLGEVDHFTAAWWYRFALNGSTESRSASVRSSPFLRCLEYAKHGLTLRALEVSLDQLAANQPLGSGQQALESITVASSAAASSNRTGSSTSTRYSTPFSTSITVASACELFSEHVNRSRLHDYCVRYLKQLGQWDSLDALASSSQTSSAFTMSGPSVSGPGGSTTAGGSSVGGSAYWGLKADAAWRRSDWSEVYSSLARLANECPRSDLCRYALIQAAACVAGRRASGFSGSASVVGGSDVDAYGSGNLGPSAIEIQSTVPGSPAVPISSSSSTSGASTSTHTMVTMLQASELENHRVMTTMLREWRRLPMIVNNQHIPLLQTAHRAVEIVEGNSLLAQYCGGTLGGPNATLPSSTYSASPGQSSSTPSSIGVPSTSNATTSAAASVALRMHEYYKTMFKSWQSRPPAIGDDLGFWHDLFSWRQVVEETIISCHPHVQKFGSERANLVAVCERELAFSQLQLARGARKHNFPSIAQQHLDRYTRMNLPPLFEKTKQEIKLKMFDLRKDELLEGLELMEKTNIQQYEKKDRAQFFCYKAVFFSHFNKGDEATKNFGYATQMQDNLHTVWSIYGDFLENVYSGYPATKRELAVSTTGIFAMQALMEAASVTGGSERRSRADVAKCLWLLTLDDTKGQQRLARTFEERSSRVRPDAFLPWLPNLVYSLLRPEGRFVASALRGVIASHPTMLYNLLRGLQHQLSTEVRYDDKLGQLLEKESPDSNAFLSALRSRVSALGSQSKDSDGKHSRGPFASMGTSGAELDSQQRSVPGSSTCGTKSINTTSSNGSASASTNITSGSHTAASKKKKRVIVVMRGVEGERLAGSAISPSHPKSLDEYESTDSPVNSTGVARKTAIRGHNASSGAGGEEAADEPDDVDLDDDNEDGDTEREDVEMLSQTAIEGKSVTSDDKFPGNLGAKTGSELSTGPDSEEQSVPTQNETVGTRCLSAMVVESLHRVNALMNQLRRRHAVRIYALDLFTNEVGGKLQPTWAEQLLAQLCSTLDYLHRLSWATVSPGRSWRIKNLTKLCIPNWLASELRFIGTSCGLRIQSPFQEDDAFLKDPPLLSPPITSPSRESVKPSTSRERSSSSSESESELEDVKPPVRSKLSDESPGRSKGDAANKGVTKGGRTTISKPSRVQWTTSMPAYDEVENLMTTKLAAEALADPWFSYIRERLANEMSDLEGRPILDVIQRLTRCWIPLVEARVARLPARLHLSDCGAIRLLEMSSLIVGNHMPLVSPNTGCASPTPSTLPGSPCLELPGQSGLFQGAASAVHSLAVGPLMQAQITNTANSGLSSHLVIADVLPHVARIRCSAGRMSPPARRLGIRASNGRVFYYDLACLGHLITSNTAAIQHEALAGARTQFLTMARGRASTLGHLTSEGLCGPAYKRWRQNGPLQLFQLINDVLATQPETAKRNLSLFVPRIMEVGPMGLCLTEVGASAPASNVVNACAHPLPSANPVSARGLTVLTRPPPLSAVSGVNSGCATSAGTKGRPPSWALPFDRIEATGGPNSDAHQQFPYKASLPNPPPAPVPSVIGTTGSVVCNTAGGSSAVAAEAIGRPSGVDAGCHPACITLSGILEHSCTTWKHHTISTTPTNSNVTSDHASRSVVLDSAGNVVKNSSLPSSQQYATPRELVCSYYEYLMDVVKHTPRTKVDTAFLVNLFTKLSDRMPQYPHLRSPVASTLGVLPESEGLPSEYSESTPAEFKRGSLVRRWAAYRMLDAESYWLLRHSVAAHLGLIALMEQLFHLTPLHPGCLVVDARSGRADARQLAFNLPHNVDMTLDLNLRSQLSSGVSDKSGPSTQLAVCFTNAMTLRAPKSCSERSTSKPDTMNDTHHTVNSSSSFWRITANPVPFRLTPNLAGFICLPGAPTNTGPFAASYTTAAQALHNSQRSHSLSSLYRTILRGDYILWHRGRQAAVHAFQLLIGEQPWPSDPLPSSDSDSDEAEGGTRRKTKLFDELGVTALRSSHVERETEQISTVTLVPDLTNEHLIQLISFTVDAMQGTLKTVSEYSAPEPNSWNFMNLATDPSRLVQMSPDWLPWL